MEKTTRLAGLVLIILSLAGWFFRYDLVVVPAGGQGIVGPAYLLNRWTGTVYIITPRSVRELAGERPQQPQ